MEKFKYAQVVKIDHVTDPHKPASQAYVDVGQLMEGGYAHDPRVGEQFKLFTQDWRYAEDNRHMHLSTSIVKSVLVAGASGQDKLVLPSDFPNPMSLKLPEVLAPGEILFATMNSIYWLRPMNQS